MQRVTSEWESLPTSLRLPLLLCAFIATLWSVGFARADENARQRKALAVTAGADLVGRISVGAEPPFTVRTASSPSIRTTYSSGLASWLDIVFGLEQRFLVTPGKRARAGFQDRVFGQVEGRWLVADRFELGLRLGTSASVLWVRKHNEELWDAAEHFGVGAGPLVGLVARVEFQPVAVLFLAEGSAEWGAGYDTSRSDSRCRHSLLSFSLNAGVEFGLGDME
jgi:hypothetical protein